MDHRPPRPDQPYAWDDERLSAYLDGELSAPEQAQLEARLVVDPELRQLVDELRAVRQQLEILPEYCLKPTFAEQVLRRAEQEMLLSPLGRTAIESPANLVPATIPVSAAPVATPVVIPLTTRHTFRRWQRGAIWTAVAAAAALLLIVTNQPGGPEQEHLARHDQPEIATPKSATVETGAVKMAEAKAAPFAADPAAQPLEGAIAFPGVPAAPTGDDQRRKELNGEAKLQPESPGAATPKQADAQRNLQTQAPAAPAIAGDAGQPVNDVPGQAAVASAPNTPSTAASPTAKNLAHDSIARSARSQDNLNGAASGKMLLKNQALPAQEKQDLQSAERLPAELERLLAANEFSLRSVPRDESLDSPSEEQLLLVYLTPGGESQGQQSFETLLSKNSIEFFDKDLAPPQPANRQRSFLEDAPASASIPKEPLTKENSAAKPSKTADSRVVKDNRKNKKSENSPPPATLAEQERPLSSTEMPREQAKASPKDYYYLEAEAGQVEELLRQLRAAPDRFARLSVSTPGLSRIANRADANEQESPAPDAFAGGKNTEEKNSDSKRRAGSAPADSQPFGKQLPEEQTQLAQSGGASATFGVNSANGPLPPPAAPAAEPAGASLAAPIPALPNPVPTANATLPESSPASLAGAAAPVTIAPAPSQTLPGNSGGSQKSASQDVDSNLSLQKLEFNKSLSQAGKDRIIAYRLRGLELPRAAYFKDRGQEAAGGFGGAAGSSEKLGLGNAKEGEAVKSEARSLSSESLQPGVASNQQKSGDVAATDVRNENAKGQADAVFPPAPRSAPNAITPQKPSALEKQAAPAVRPAQAADDKPMPTKAGEDQRLLARDKTANGDGDHEPVDAGKKSAPPTTKRVRVLFVIEHLPPQE